jgi:hypothetical protein
MGRIAVLRLELQGEFGELTADLLAAPAQPVELFDTGNHRTPPFEG